MDDSEAESDNNFDNDFENQNENNPDVEMELEIPAFNYGPWIGVMDTERFELQEMRAFEERTGPVDVRAGDQPHEIFLSMLTVPDNMDVNVVDILVEETNRYAHQRIAEDNLRPHSRLQAWRDVDSYEMKAFIGLFLLMGLVKKPTVSSYWENHPDSWLSSTPSFGSVMPRDRFLSILSNLHATNNQTALPRDHPQYDRMWKAKPIVDTCNAAFRQNYRLARDICVDERIVGFKGRHNLIQYVSKKKNHQWGAKLWVLSESDTGYTEQVKVYQGKGNGNHPHGIGYSVVTSLVEVHYNKSHHVTTDSLFSSPKLCHDLLDRNTYFTGTVLAHRRGMAASFKNLKTPKGTVTAKKQRDVLAVHWSDRRQVQFVTSSDHCRMETASNSKGKEKVAPGIVHTYNKTMGGVDLGDQLISVYEPDFRSVKLWKKILFNLLLTACVNAYICHQRSFLLRRKKTHLQFQYQIILGLIGDFRAQPVVRRNLNVNRGGEARHIIYMVDGGKRRKCIICGRKVRTWCKHCKVGVCVGDCFLGHLRSLRVRIEE